LRLLLPLLLPLLLLGTCQTACCCSWCCRLPRTCDPCITPGITSRSCSQPGRRCSCCAAGGVCSGPSTTTSMCLSGACCCCCCRWWRCDTALGRAQTLLRCLQLEGQASCLRLR
jgi:hypothetical protein